jgi:toxin ParE1/3/4
MGSVSRRYRLSPEARADLEDIWLYTAERWSLEQADRYHNRLIDALEALADTPARGVAADHIRPGYRRLRAGSHVVFYLPLREGIEIIRILHSRMDFGHHL